MALAKLENILIIGAGQAASQAANSLRQMGFEGTIRIFGNEGQPPYQRPPLSKAYMLGQMPAERLYFKAAEQWEKDNIDLKINEEIISIDAANKNIKSKNGNQYDYDKLIIATGSKVRHLPVEGAQLNGVHYLKTIQDSDDLGNELDNGKNLVIIGAGYIGLEVAACAQKKGLNVTIIEAAPRILARVASPELSQFYENVHESAGVNILTQSGVTKINGTQKVESVTLSDGTNIDADVVLIGIGIIPNDEIAKVAGIVCNNGIDVDENAKTSNSDIYACGDCANRMVDLYGQRMRLESVHNAIEQAKLAAANIMGQNAPKLDIPWFWSDQYDLKLQIAGLAIGATKTIIRGDMAARKFALFHLNDENRILAIDAINSPPEFLVGKNLIAARAKIAPDILQDTNISVKELANHIQN